MNELTLTAAWDELRNSLKDPKPAYTIAQANKRGYCDVLAGNGRWYRVSSKGGNKFTIRPVPNASPARFSRGKAR